MLRMTDKGIAIDDFDTIYKRLVEKFRAIYGQDVNLDSDTPDGQLLGLFTQELSDIHQAVTFIVQMLDPYQAQGTWLEQRAMYAGLLRRRSSYSYVDDVILTGTPKTNIPVDSIFIDQNKNKWVTLDRVELNDLGSARVKIRSEQAGAFNLKKSDELQQSTVIIGLEKITANSNSYGGADEESDADFVARFMKSHAINNSEDQAGIQAKLSNLKGVEKCIIYENYTSETDDKGIPPHSMNAVVLGGDHQEIIETLTKAKRGGCGFFGQIEGEIYYREALRKAKYDRPEKRNVTVSLTITRYKTFEDIDIESIKENLKALDFEIGENVYATRIISSINLTNGFYITNLTVNNGAIVETGDREYAVINKVEVLFSDE
ncbi:baseplate J/gp47 family protein [Ignatzschineria larvae DSM 13226]|uniref:Baseplate J/gp47 family protein n=1 Tax=Ignatzschineria larvae DSM 13226 TaxID=1111732 RepID=A0ABZ3BYY2_9GAMM|nr:baseplate J/gp47 family protein [Ignatzschineria larvae]